MSEAVMTTKAGYDQYKHLIEPDSKPSNPKDLIGTDKLPLSLVPATGIAVQALAHLEGNLKYGLVNWREAGVRSSIYLDAALRHLEKLINGEWEDPVTKVPHVGSISACMNIIVDAKVAGKLIDDRPRPAPVAEFIDSLSENVRHLRQLFANKNPIHYTIEGPVQVKPEEEGVQEKAPSAMPEPKGHFVEYDSNIDEYWCITCGARWAGRANGVPLPTSCPNREFR